MNNDDLPKPLPCPFCGSSGVSLTHRGGRLFWNVECHGCRARGPETRASAIGEAERASAIYHARRTAIEGWNRNRRTPEAIREWMEKEELREDA